MTTLPPEWLKSFISIIVAVTLPLCIHSPSSVFGQHEYHSCLSQFHRRRCCEVHIYSDIKMTDDAARLPTAVIPTWCFPRDGVVNHRENGRRGFYDYPANRDKLTEGVSYHWCEEWSHIEHIVMKMAAHACGAYIIESLQGRCLICGQHSLFG